MHLGAAIVLVLLVNAVMDGHDCVARHTRDVTAPLELRLTCIHWISFGVLQVSL